MVSIVSRNPDAVWIVSAVPTYSLGATSATHAENCAESATTDMPQMNASTIVRLYDQVDAGPMTSAQVPLIAIAMMVTRARPIRSARIPAMTQPMAPAAITAKASTGAHNGAMACSRPACARKTPIVLHIANNSHMWPRYPPVARRTSRSPSTRPIALESKGADGAWNGPSRTATAKSTAPSNAQSAAINNTGRHSFTFQLARRRCGAAEPTETAPTSIPMAVPRCRSVHPAAIFIPGGYTHASDAPVTRRNAIACQPVMGSTAIAAVAAAASSEDTAA